MRAVQWFRASYPDVLAFHVPNGELRHPRVAEKLQRMGVLPGVWDWLMFPLGGVKCCIEYKSERGELSAEQIAFAKLWGRDGNGLCFEVRTLEEFQATCIGVFGEPAAPYDPSAPLEIDEAAVREMMQVDTYNMPPTKLPWET